MKIHFLMFLGILFSVSAVGHWQRNMTTDLPELRADEKEMERKFLVRDTFKEKGNAGKYIKYHSFF